MTVNAFAKREGLDAERLYRWRRRFAREREAVGPALIELRPTPSARRAEPVEIVLGSGVVVRVAETIDPATLARLVAALERGC
jgi:transposase-like protein